MASKTQKAKVKEYIVTVKENPSYCGEGAGGAQFAHGSAQSQMIGLRSGSAHMMATP